MSYLAFHLVFIVPPLLLLARAVPAAGRVLGPRALWTLPAVALIALVYTTPWDNYLVWRGVWWYGPDRVLGTIGHVPVEEYLFFILQPLLTGAWLYHLLLRGGGDVAMRGSGDMAVRGGTVAPRGGRLAPRGATAPEPAGASTMAPKGTARGVGVLLYALLTAGGFLAITYQAGLYLGLILLWVGPVLAAQWWFMAAAALRLRRVFVLAIGVPTLYLWVADRVAIGLGIWSISPEYTTGLHLAGLPVEEAVFFLLTNVLVVQGALLFLQPVLDPAGPAVRRSEMSAAPARRALQTTRKPA